MKQPIPSQSRRHHLLQKALKSLPLSGQTGELFGVLDDLFETVLTPTYLLHEDADNPPEHHTTVLRYMMEIASGERFDWPLLRQAATIALLHDIWPVRKITREMIRKAPEREKPKLEEERKNSVPIHMQKGAQHSRDILNRLNKRRAKEEYDSAAIDRICGVIAIHDNPKIGIPIPTADTLAVSFREADRLWMQDPCGVRADLARNGNNYPSREDLVVQARDNVESFREERAKAYATLPLTDFIDNETIFRTKTGHGIFQRLRTYWDYERLRAVWEAVQAEADH